MGLLKGTTTFSIWRVNGPLPDHFHIHRHEQLRKFSFQESTMASAEKALGWTSLENVLDTDFASARYALGKFFLFALRIDRKIIPPSLLKIRVLEAERRLRAEGEQQKIYRHQREDIKDRIRLDLLSKTQPSPSFFDVCWSVPDSRVLFCTLSEKVTDDFRTLFKQAFQMPLSPFTPWDSAAPAPEMAGLIKDVDPTSLGRDFLTWLWFKSEERGGSIRFGQEEDIEVQFIKRLVLVSGQAEYAETVVCQGLHADLREGKEALRHGKKIREARIRLKRGRAESEFTFKADSFHFQSFKLPVSMEGDNGEADKDGRLLERLYLLEGAIGTMEALFALFLKTRLSDRWASEDLSRMEKWLAR